LTPVLLTRMLMVLLADALCALAIAIVLTANTVAIAAIVTCYFILVVL
jgi:hypothetical protein